MWPHEVEPWFRVETLDLYFERDVLIVLDAKGMPKVPLRVSVPFPLLILGSHILVSHLCTIIISMSDFLIISSCKWVVWLHRVSDYHKNETLYQQLLQSEA